MREKDIFDRIVSVSWLRWFQPLYNRYRELWLYALFGLGTVIINLSVYSIFTEGMKVGILISNAIAWVFATLFAFFTNRRWVFISHARGWKAFLLQLGSFCFGRAITLFIEEWALFFFIGILKFPNMLVKTIALVVVIALNYLVSKLIVFRKRK